MADKPAQDRKLHLPTIEVNGRFFTKYDPNIALDIVERVAEGELLSDICDKRAPNPTVSKSTFMRWVATVPELQSAFAAAKQLSALSFEEMAIKKAQRTADAPGSPQNVSAASLLVGQYRWSAARRNPTVYSDKGNTQIVVPVNINTTLDMGGSRQTLDVEVPDIYTIKIADKNIVDGEFSEIEHKSTDVLDATPREGANEEQDKEVSPIQDFKSAVREALRVDEPVRGTERQPLYVKNHKYKGKPGPRKRVLTPGYLRPGPKRKNKDAAIH